MNKKRDKIKTIEKQEHKIVNIKVYLLIANLIIATFAFSWILSDNFVNAQEELEDYYLEKGWQPMGGIQPPPDGYDYFTDKGVTWIRPKENIKTPQNQPSSQIQTATGLLPAASLISKGGGVSGTSWIVSTEQGDLLVKNMPKDKLLASTNLQGIKLNTEETYKLGEVITDANVRPASLIESNYGTEMVTLSDGQTTLSKMELLETGTSEQLNDVQTLKAFDARSITKDGNKITLNQKNGAETNIDLKGGQGGQGSISGKGEGSSTLSKLFGQSKGTFGDAALSGVQWAAIAYGLGQMIGGLAGFDTSQTQALSTAMSAGTFAYKFMATHGGISGKIGSGLWGPAGPGAMGYGLIVGGIVFALMYKKESKEVVTFTCKPWSAPVGGNDCEKCNDEAGCSEYRCKSLGQACELLNVGSTEERCAWVNPRDVKSPGISPWEDVLTKGYSYTDVRIRPAGEGGEPGRMRIVKSGSSNGCVEAFTPLEFGIRTIGPDGEDEPAQCKIDYNHTLKFENMPYYVGESNMYRYNHSQKLSLPSPAAIEEAAPELKHDGTYSLYVRCMDKNGNENVDEFVISFCVDPTQDTTAPKVEGTSIGNDMPVKFNQSTVDLDVYVNEPASCKWSRDDKGYNLMENEMKCNNNVWEMNNNMVYTCKANLTGVKSRQENIFYFKCKDNPSLNESKRNTMAESYVFTLFGTEPLNIIDVSPNDTTVKGSTSVVSVDIEVETANGYKNGEAICSYNDKESESSWIDFFETGTSIHKQRLDLNEGTYKYYIKCVDLGGNRDDSFVNFTVDVDTESPTVVRAYHENELLKIITDEESTCKFSTQSCNFLFEDGIDMPYSNETAHIAEWKTDNTFYIRCSDNYGNIPISNTCSIVVRPYDVVKQKVEED